MNMKIKQIDNVTFKKDPLIEVIGQISFPTVISINDKMPTEFQTRMKAMYPFFNLKQPKRLEVRIKPSEEHEFEEVLGPKEYCFTSKDEKEMISFSSNFVAFSTTNYTGWSDFLPKLENALTVLNDIYDLGMITRVGLRYKDLIVREKYGLEDVPWNELIEDSIIGMPSNGNLFEDSPDWESVLGSSLKYRLKFKNSELIFQSGFADRSVTDGNQGFYIDSDFFNVYEQGINFTDFKLIDEMESLHENGYAVFRHSIKNRLYDALEPQEATSTK